MFFIIVLIALGLLFLVVELLLLTGSTVGGVLSLVCYGSAIYMAYHDYGVTTGTVIVAAIILLSLVATVISLRAKTWQRLSLKQEIDSASMEMPEQCLKIGDCGISVSRLSPMGKVEIDGRIYEAKSVDAYVEPKSEIEVVGFENFNVIVKKSSKK